MLHSHDWNNHLNRHFRKELRMYLNQISSKVALVDDDMKVEVLRNHPISETEAVEHKMFYSMTKPVVVPLSNIHSIEDHSERSHTWTNMSSSENTKSGSSYFSPDVGSSSKLEKSGNISVVLPICTWLNIVYTMLGARRQGLAIRYGFLEHTVYFAAFQIQF